MTDVTAAMLSAGGAAIERIIDNCPADVLTVHTVGANLAEIYRAMAVAATDPWLPISTAPKDGTYILALWKPIMPDGQTQEVWPAIVRWTEYDRDFPWVCRGSNYPASRVFMWTKLPEIPLCA